MTQVANLLPPLNPTVANKWRELLNIFHLDDGRSHGEVLTDTQVQIIDVIAKRRFPRTILILPTQYGKSMAVADGVLIRILSHKEKWAIVAPSEDKARIIMDYIIDRIFDDQLFIHELEYHNTKEKLKQERSKTRITFRNGGEVRVYSGNASNTRQTKSALMGFGAANIVLDEAGQISDELYSTVKRMVGGSKDNFILEIGNPVYRNHFHKIWFGSRYKKIFMDVYTALAEGRYTPEFIDEMREEAGFEWMYECKFPDATEVLPNGYRRLVSDIVVDDSFTDAMPNWQYEPDEDGNPKENKWGFKIIDDKVVLGVDPAGGGTNKTKFVLRFPKYDYTMVARTSESDDLEVLADIAEELIREWNVTDYRTVIDAGGVGHGLPAILRARGHLVKAVLFGERTIKNSLGEVLFKIPDTFKNMRAYMYWEARTWLRDAQTKLLRDEGFLELKLINYRQDSSLRTQIEPKTDMIKRLAQDGTKVESPDTADAFVLTFVDTSGIIELDDIDMD